MALLDIVKWEVSNKELVYKYPSGELRLGSQLIVYPGQTALFLKGGKVYKEFDPGTYTIKSENVPLLDKIIKMPFGKQSPFQAEVWFINQISLLDCKWGTITPLQIEDPEYGVIVPIRAFGQYGFRINNPRVFLERLVGNMHSFVTDKLIDYFRGVILSKLTAIVFNKLRQDNISVLNINSKVDELSDYAKECLVQDFLEYGVSMEAFKIISVSVKEDDPSFQRLKVAKDEAAKIKIIGRENYQMLRSFNVLEMAAANEGNGTMGAAIGVGAGVGIGNQVGAIAAQMLNTNTVNPDNIPPIPSSEYYLAINGKRVGPLNAEQVEQKYIHNEITENTLVWKKGMKTWKKIVEIEDFQSMFDGNCPPPLPV